MPDATELRDAAIDRVRRHAHAEWLVCAERALYRTCCVRELFSSLDVLAAITEDVSTHEARAMGAVMRTGARNGWCAPSGQYGKSERRQSHARPVAIWRSKIAGPIGFNHN